MTIDSPDYTWIMEHTALTEDDVRDFIETSTEDARKRGMSYVQYLYEKTDGRTHRVTVKAWRTRPDEIKPYLHVDP